MPSAATRRGARSSVAGDIVARRARRASSSCGRAANIAAGEARALARGRRRSSSRGETRFRAGRTCSSCATRTGTRGCGAAADVARARSSSRSGCRSGGRARARGYVATLRRQPRRSSCDAAVARACSRDARGSSASCASSPRRSRGCSSGRRQRASSSRELFQRADVHYILIASRGSSSNAARYAQYLLGRANRVPVAFATPSLYTLYEQPPRLDGALVIGISQSRRVAGRARGDRRGAAAGPADDRDHERGRVAARGREPRRCCRSRPASELAVAATKTYVNSLGAIALLFARRPATSGAERARARARAARRADRRGRRDATVDALGALEGGTVVARGINYGTCVRDRAQDPRALGPALRGVVGGRPDARPGRGDRRRAGRCSRSRRPGPALGAMRDGGRRRRASAART